MGFRRMGFWRTISAPRATIGNDDLKRPEPLPSPPHGPTTSCRCRRSSNIDPRTYPCASLGLVAAGVLAFLAASSGSAAAANLFQPIGEVAEAQSTHFLRVALIALVAIVPALVATPIVLWRARMSNQRAVYEPNWSFNRWYEFAIWAGPIAIVCVLSYWLIHATRTLDPYVPLPGDQLRIDLVGLDWKWLAIYPDQRVAAVDQIVIPVDQPVAFRLTADTVMQSFLPNGIAGQIYLMPGMITRLHVKANEEGEGLAEQTQYNGDGFANQRVAMRAVSRDEFDAWVASASGAALDGSTYPVLAESGSTSREIGAARERLLPLGDQCLFDRVVARYHQGTAIPPEAQPGSPLYRAEAGGLPGGSCADVAESGAGAMCRPAGGKFQYADLLETLK